MWLAPRIGNSVDVQRMKESWRINPIGIKKGLSVKGGQNSFAAVLWKKPSKMVSLCPNEKAIQNFRKENIIQNSWIELLWTLVIFLIQRLIGKNTDFNPGGIVNVSINSPYAMATLLETNNFYT